MFNIQQVTEAINLYRQNKGFIRKLNRTDHPAIVATEAYLKSLQLHEGLLSNQDLFNINRFFLLNHPVKPGRASYTTWFSINYQNFCALNYGSVKKLAELLGYPVSIKYAGFATCSKAGYQKFPDHFSKLTLDQLDNRSNTEKMQEFFQVLRQCYLENNFTDDNFLALSKLCIEGMLTQEYITAIKKSNQANFLAICLIKMKHTNTLTTENQNFIISYPKAITIPVAQILIALDKSGLNTLTNRKILADFSMPIPLYRVIKLLEKLALLTQENFDLISAEKNLSWLIALEGIPDELVTPEIWEGLRNFLKNESDSYDAFRKDIKEYADMLKKKLNVEQIKNDILASEDPIKIQAVSTSTARSRFFSVEPVSLPATLETATPKVSYTG